MSDRDSRANARAHEPIGYHSWHDLLFLHWPVPAEQLAGLLPPGVTLDTWQGTAWVGLVAFRMTGIRPWWFPPLPYLSAFAETNVRTYVRWPDEEPGVLFLSLDAPRLAAVLVARRRWRLNYRWARMSVEHRAGRISYRSRRFGHAGACARIEASLTDEIGDGGGNAIEHMLGDVTGQPLNERGECAAQPGTLHHFLTERYTFYNLAADGRWQQGRVRHPAYRFAPVRLEQIEQSLLAAAGLSVAGPPAHVCYCPGVDVAIHRLRRLPTGRQASLGGRVTTVNQN